MMDSLHLTIPAGVKVLRVDRQIDEGGVEPDEWVVEVALHVDQRSRKLGIAREAQEALNNAVALLPRS